MVIKGFSTLQVKLGGWVIQQQVPWSVAKKIWTGARVYTPQCKELQIKCRRVSLRVYSKTMRLLFLGD